MRFTRAAADFVQKFLGALVRVVLHHVAVAADAGGIARLAAQRIAAVRIGGHISLIGVLAGYAGPVPTMLLMAKQIRLIGITVGTRAEQLDMIRAIDANGLKPVIDRHFSLAELGAAFRHQESGAHFGKICVDI